MDGADEYRRREQGWDHLRALGMMARVTVRQEGQNTVAPGYARAGLELPDGSASGWGYLRSVQAPES